MQLKDQVAIITGGASLRGIGWATAKRFAGEGARIVILDLDAAAAGQAARAIGLVLWAWPVTCVTKQPANQLCKRCWKLSGKSISSSTTPVSASRIA